MTIGSRAPCVHELFQRQVSRTPGRVAIVHRGRAVTYHELNEMANRCARLLRSHGVGPETLVGVLGDRSPRLVAALIGILKAGGAYVPLDPRHPSDRLARIVEDAGVRLVLSDRPGVPAAGGGVVRLTFDWAECSAPSANVSSGVDADNMAAVIYTSGSTGDPKGVILSHWAIAARLSGGVQRFARGSMRCQKASIGLVTHLADLLLPLMRGLSLVVVDDHERSNVAELARLAQARGIPILGLVPSQLRVALRTGEALAALRGLRTIVVSGEPITPELVTALKRELPQVTLVNSYGSTETAGSVSTIALEDGEPVTIGRAGFPPRIYILDERLKSPAMGEVGELCVRGPQLARGYLHRRALTEDVFTLDPFTRDGTRLYRTGDRGRFLPDGRIQLMGRADNQVKIRGFRVNLEEVEAALLRHPAVDSVAALLGTTASGDPFLRACVKRSHLGADCDAARLTAYAREQLPPHMVPALVHFVEHLPLLANGKLDRRRCDRLSANEGATVEELASAR